MTKPACPICRSGDSQEAYRASRQPALLNQLLPTRAAALAYPAVDLEFRGCRACGFVWNSAFDPDAVDYAAGYVNDQSLSPAFRRHMDDVVDRLAAGIADVPGAIIEVACGQGDFLRSLCSRTGRRGVGFDPAYAGPSGEDRGVTCHARFFSDGEIDRIIGASTQVALIVCRHVMGSLPDPASMAALFARLRGHSPRACAYVEVPDFGWIAENASFFDLYHESCSLFTTRTLARVLEEAGCGPTRVDRVFDGQYLAAHAGSDDAAASDEDSDGLEPTCFAALADRLGRQRAEWQDRAERLISRGSLVIWGAGGKGVSFANQLGLDWKRAPFMVDINPGKWGKHVPLTGQQVVSPAQLPRLIGDRPSGQASILVLNPSYADEIRRQAGELGVSASIEVFDPEAAVETRR